jgi:hypothetical protein
MAFEQLVAEAAMKKEKKKDKSKKGDSRLDPHHYSSEAAADAPNVPRA